MRVTYSTHRALRPWDSVVNLRIPGLDSLPHPYDKCQSRVRRGGGRQEISATSILMLHSLGDGDLSVQALLATQLYKDGCNRPAGFETGFARVRLRRNCDSEAGGADGKAGVNWLADVKPPDSDNDN